MTATATIELGDEAQDRVTGFKGIVTAVTRWRNGNRKAQLQPQELKDGKPIEPFEFDFEDLTVLSKQKVAPVAVSYDGPIEMGDEVRDKTGYVGIVDEIRTSLAGCVQFGAYARKTDKDGMPVRGIIRHSSDFTLVKKNAEAPLPEKKQTGAAPPARSAR